jgi:hypothetical protein
MICVKMRELREGEEKENRIVWGEVRLNFSDKIA